MPPPAPLPPISTPTQIVTGSPDLLSGRVADPAGDRVDAIHVYRDLDGNGVLDPGSDGLLLADTTPADGYAFNAGSLPSGRHVLYVAAMKDGAVAGSITTTLVAARWWSVSIGSLTDGESRLPTTGDLVADPTPIELAPGPGGGTWKDAATVFVSCNPDGRLGLDCCKNDLMFGETLGERELWRIYREWYRSYVARTGKEPEKAHAPCIPDDGLESDDDYCAWCDRRNERENMPLAHPITQQCLYNALHHLEKVYPVARGLEIDDEIKAGEKARTEPR